MPTLHHAIRTAFDFLLDRGYSLIESEGGMAGTVAYRSPVLWISIDWEFVYPSLTFTFLRAGPEPLSWTEVDSLMNGRVPEARNASRTIGSARVEQLSVFVKENIDKIEQLVRPDEWPRVEGFIREVLARRPRGSRTHRFH